jgi:hypothetical protein
LEVYIIVGWKEGSSSARRGMDVSKEWVFAGDLREYDVEGEKEGEESSVKQSREVVLAVVE